MGLFDFLTYNKFKQKKWKRLSPKKRLNAFQKMENIVARKKNRPVMAVIPQDWNDGTNGLCDYSKKTIFLNSKFCLDEEKQFLGLATLFHEQRHSEQYFIISTKKKLFKLSKAYRWKKNMEGYINYDGKEKYSYYSMQEVERDANKHAINYLKKFKYRYRKEQLYFYTLDYKIKQYDNVKDLAKKELGFFYRLKLLFRERRERKKNK